VTSEEEDRDPTRPEKVRADSPFANWSEDPSYQAQGESAIRANNALNSHIVSAEELPLPSDGQQFTPETSSVEPAQIGDALDGKLGWVMEYVDSLNQPTLEQDRLPTADAGRERQPGYYDELVTAPLPETATPAQDNSLAWALAEAEVTQPNPTLDHQHMMDR
jgi:hypothetical protein